MCKISKSDIKQNFKKYIIWPLGAWLYIFVCLYILPNIEDKILENILFNSIPLVLFILTYIGYIKSIQTEKNERIFKFYVKQIIALLITSVINGLVYLVSGCLILKVLNFYNLANVSAPIEIYTVIFCGIYISGMIGIKILLTKKGYLELSNLILFSSNFIILISLIFIAMVYTRFW